MDVFEGHTAAVSLEFYWLEQGAYLLSVVLVFNADKNRNIVVQLHAPFSSRSFFKNASQKRYVLSFGITYFLFLVSPCVFCSPPFPFFHFIPSFIFSHSFFIHLPSPPPCLNSRLFSFIFSPSLQRPCFLK